MAPQSTLSSPCSRSGDIKQFTAYPDYDLKCIEGNSLLMSLAGGARADRMADQTVPGLDEGKFASLWGGEAYVLKIIQDYHSFF
jgi:hypothetical protein